LSPLADDASSGRPAWRDSRHWSARDDRRSATGADDPSGPARKDRIAVRSAGRIASRVARRLARVWRLVRVHWLARERAGKADALAPAASAPVGGVTVRLPTTRRVVTITSRRPSGKSCLGMNPKLVSTFTSLSVGTDHHTVERFVPAFLACGCVLSRDLLCQIAGSIRHGGRTGSRHRLRRSPRPTAADA